MIYIGQSQNIEDRYNEHLRKLRNNLATNYKLQECYNLYGRPELVVLEECSLENLNSLELAWQNEFNSITNGLDLVEAGQVGRGPQSNNSKYSKMQILRVFILLAKTDLSQLEIAKKVRCNKSLPNDIKNKRIHLWLKEDYPILYQKMIERTNYNKLTHKIGVGYLSTFISPEGKEYITSNAKDLARLLYPNEVEVARKGFSRLRSGSRKSWRGWTVN